MNNAFYVAARNSQFSREIICPFVPGLSNYFQPLRKSYSDPENIEELFQFFVYNLKRFGPHNSRKIRVKFVEEFIIIFMKNNFCIKWIKNLISKTKYRRGMKINGVVLSELHSY